jgi:hypothetical protein
VVTELALALAISLGLFPPKPSTPPSTDPDSGRTKLQLALWFRAAGDERWTLPLLRDLAQAKAAAGGMGGPGEAAGVDPLVQSKACVTLADHYFAKKQWKEALRWYEAWVPVIEGCGLAQVAADQHRWNRIAACRKELGLKP